MEELRNTLNCGRKGTVAAIQKLWSDAATLAATEEWTNEGLRLPFSFVELRYHTYTSHIL